MKTQHRFWKSKGQTRADLTVRLDLIFACTETTAGIHRHFEGYTVPVVFLWVRTVSCRHVPRLPTSCTEILLVFLSVVSEHATRCTLDAGASDVGLAKTVQCQLCPSGVRHVKMTYTIAQSIKVFARKCNVVRFITPIGDVTSQDGMVSLLRSGSLPAN